MWFVFALISTLFLVGRNILNKKGVEKLDPIFVTFSTFLFSFPVAFIAMLFNDFVISSTEFYSYLGIRIVLDLIALIALLNAFKLRSVSFVVPLLALQPMISILFSKLLGGGDISGVQILGMVIVTIGSILIYLIELSKEKFKLTPELIKATVLVGITTIIYSILDPLHGKIIGMSNEYTYFFISTIIFSVIMFVVVLIKSRGQFFSEFKSKRELGLSILIGLSLGFEVLFLFLALGSTEATPLVSAVRILNIGLTAVLASKLLNESVGFKNYVAIGISIIGVVLIIL